MRIKLFIDDPCTAMLMSARGRPITLNLPDEAFCNGLPPDLQNPIKSPGHRAGAFYSERSLVAFPDDGLLLDHILVDAPSQ
jgi:hypothetical protein